MKKIFLVAVVALLATPLFASEMKFDGKLGYARVKDGGNGFVVGPAMYYSLYNDTGFIKDLSVGLGLDVTMAKFSGTFDGSSVSAWGYNFLFTPEARLEMPYSYFKLGFGYDYFRIVGVNNNMFAMKFAVGGLYPIAEGTRLGLDFTFDYMLTKGNLSERIWIINVGPVLSFDL